MWHQRSLQFTKHRRDTISVQTNKVMVSPASRHPSLFRSIHTRANSSNWPTWVKQQSLARGVGSSSGQKDEQSKQRGMTPPTASLTPYNRDQPHASTGGSTKPRRGERSQRGTRLQPRFTEMLSTAGLTDRHSNREVRHSTWTKHLFIFFLLYPCPSFPRCYSHSPKK